MILTRTKITEDETPFAKQPGYQDHRHDLQSHFVRTYRVPGRMSPKFNSGSPPVELRHLLFASTLLVDFICAFAIQCVPDFTFVSTGRLGTRFIGVFAARLMTNYLGFSPSIFSDEESKEDDRESSAHSAADNTRY